MSRDSPAQRLFDSYVLHARKSGVRRRSIETTIGMFLNKVAPGLRRRDGHYKVWSVGEMVETPGSVYEFPPLAECREAFAKLMQQDFEWGGPEEWREVPPPDVEAGGPM